MIVLGGQLSTAKGLDYAIFHAAQYGLGTLQVFSRSPVGGQSKPLPKTGTVTGWLEQAHIRPFFVHAPYFVNPAATEPLMKNRARVVLSEEMIRVKRLHGDYLILHPGHQQETSIEESLDALSQTIRYILKKPGFVLIENAAGQGRELGASLDDLARLFAHLGRLRRVGFLLDTAHAMAFGYALTTADDVSRFFDQLDQKIGLKRLKGIHLNDNMYPIGTKRDRHAHLLTGQMHPEGLKKLLALANGQNWPIILETPGKDMVARHQDLEVIAQLTGHELKMS
ncbi:Endonuclease IV [Sulfobacillus thermosulfidooxidans DSM 9293]|uniref:Endonuclease IV n=2 Tax=Sulfobacillus thermosulfidooxidans TaxID=28034 RepID=A0A1W1WKS4_SULTA|nr:deoxyribonuclease IV [Sulfobacillus thermosulfidooxidans]PSR27677.1 MAG: endonuclease IV [Sulfobacillus thermosulfidooxidans]SMC06610.1 Endonuclease IV [Sulfobacillus thermosulfidooxidans DSM 9293]